jgi:hypothetical protein
MANANPSPSTRFPPGNSANPGGRPKGKSLTTRLREILDANELEGVDLADGEKVADVLAQVIVRKALAGDFRFVELVFNRIDGKVPDKISIGSDGTSDAIRDYLSGINGKAGAAEAAG